MKVICTDKVPATTGPLIEAAGHEWEDLAGIYTDKDKLIAALKDCDACIIRSGTKLTRDILEAAVGRIKVVVRAGVGLDNIDLVAAKELGIFVSNTPNATTNGVAELALCLMLCATRKVCAAHAKMTEGGWDRATFGGNECFGKTLGIVGCGRIGRRFGTYARALGMDVIGFDNYGESDEVVTLVSMEELQKRADFITLHVPATEQTKGMINSEFLSKCKSNCVIINTARGAVINEEDLNKALNDGVIAGAALDVYCQEPPAPENPLRTNPKVTHLPHLGASCAEGQTRACTEACEIIIKKLAE